MNTSDFRLVVQVVSLFCGLAAAVFLLMYLATPDVLYRTAALWSGAGCAAGLAPFLAYRRRRRARHRADYTDAAIRSGSPATGSSAGVEVAAFYGSGAAGDFGGD